MFDTVCTCIFAEFSSLKLQRTDLNSFSLSLQTWSSNWFILNGSLKIANHLKSTETFELVLWQNFFTWRETLERTKSPIQSQFRTHGPPENSERIEWALFER